MNICVVAKGFPPEVGGIEEYSSAVYTKLNEIFTGLVTAYVFVTESKENSDFVSIEKSKLEIINFLKLFFLVFKGKHTDTVFWATTWKVALPLYLLNKRYFVTAHGNEFLRSELILKKLMKIVYSKAEKIICVSKYTRDRLISRFEFYGKKNVVVAHNGISEKFVKAISKSLEDRKNIIFYTVCRLEKKKNVKNAIIAFSKLVSNKNITAKFRIAGIGTEEDNLKSLVQELSIEKIVHFYGYINEDDLLRLHTTSDVFLHPNIELDNGSDVEGFGLVIADAAACGNIPIVGSVGGPTEIVEKLSFGYVVDGNHVDEIVKAMKACLSEGMTDRDRMLRKTKAISSFNWNNHVLEVVRDLLTS